MRSTQEAVINTQYRSTRTLMLVPKKKPKGWDRAPWLDPKGWEPKNLIRKRKSVLTHLLTCISKYQNVKLPQTNSRTKYKVQSSLCEVRILHTTTGSQGYLPCTTRHQTLSVVQVPLHGFRHPHNGISHSRVWYPRPLPSLGQSRS